MRRLGDTGYASAGETTLASAATVDLGTSKNRNIAVSGTTTITSFGTAAGREVLLRFAGALTLTYNATSLILPGAANIVTAPGDTCIATSDASGNWTVRQYQRGAVAPLTPGWIAYTPTVTAASGTFTALGTVTGTYSRNANTVDMKAAVPITTNGTAAVAVFVTLPLTPRASGGSWYGSGRDQSTGKMLQAEAQGGTAYALLRFYDNSYPGADGTTLRFSLTYETT